MQFHLMGANSEAPIRPCEKTEISNIDQLKSTIDWVTTIMNVILDVVKTGFAVSL